MSYLIRKLYRPEFYQGPLRITPYFEGWYFKVVSAHGAFALIPGVSRSPDDPHAFIQLITARGATAHYHRYPLSAFSFTKREFSVSVGANLFSLSRIEVALDDLSAELTIRDPLLWRGTLVQPGTMGWYSFVPFMECKHAVIAMDATVAGRVNTDGISGRLYVEKDYGRSFPNAWVWLQSNSFEERGVSVSCSIANVPFVGGAFTGFLAGITVGGRLYKFTTYYGARLEELSVEERTARIVLANQRYTLVILATREEGADLRSPREGAMLGRVTETLQSSVDVELTESGRRVYKGRGDYAGLEVVNPERLLPQPRRR